MPAEQQEEIFQDIKKLQQGEAYWRLQVETFTEIRSVSEEDSYLRLIDACITQL